jgi:hypothetical protein
MPTIGTYGRTDLDPTVRANPHRFAFASFYPSGGVDKCMLVLHSSESVRAVYEEITATDFVAGTRLDDIFYPFIWAVKDEQTGDPILDGEDGSNIYDGNTGGLPNTLITPTILYTDGDPEQPATGKEIPSFSLSRDGVNLFALNPFGTYREISPHSSYKTNENGDRTGLYGKGIGLRGPIIMTGWGYDISGFPFPSGNTDESRGFAGSTSGLTISAGADVDPARYVSAPIDFRYDQFRNVYTTERHETTRLITLIAGDPTNGYTFVGTTSASTGPAEDVTSMPPPYPLDAIGVKAYDASFSSFLTLPHTTIANIMMFPVANEDGVVNYVPRWVFRNSERSFLAKITGHSISGGFQIYTFEPVGTGGGGDGVLQKAINLVELNHSEGVDTLGTAYPSGFSRKPIGAQGNSDEHAVDAYVEMYRLPASVTGFPSPTWGTTFPEDVRFYFMQPNAHDGTCEE